MNGNRVMSLAEYLREEEPFRATSYLDHLPSDLLWYLKNFLSHTDIVLLETSRIKEGRAITRQEIEDAAESERIDRMEEAWWADYEPDQYEEEYGDEDFDLYQDWEDEDEEY